MSTPDNQHEALDSFIAKWRDRWPEWSVAEVFLPASRRQTAYAWFTLLQEFTDAAWSGEDATPGLAKLAWWGEELRGWAKGARRHPLGATLQRQPVDWIALSGSLRELQAARGIVPPALSGLQAFAAAVARIEAILFEGENGQGGAVDRVLADVLAEHALSHGATDQARTLVAARLRGREATRPRRIQSALLYERLSQLAADQPLRAARPWRSVWLAWRAARSE
ncbi:phytoene/squalene synthase family protein [Luteimonas panaciterrae]|uniref:phytoene/squalene synthase family protein n=1 Tax=Luteimonas panaciterrae TaxID=363885 RepID=UPI001CFBE70B|nr:phytoene/squalene synthase family protein [Luteimonas panaciterrae]